MPLEFSSWGDGRAESGGGDDANAQANGCETLSVPTSTSSASGQFPNIMHMNYLLYISIDIYLYLVLVLYKSLIIN